MAHGNRKAQNKRKHERKNDLPPRQKDAYQLIDNNWTHYPVAYCDHYKGWLSLGQIQTHRCHERQCKKIIMVFTDE